LLFFTLGVVVLEYENLVSNPSLITTLLEWLSATVGLVGWLSQGFVLIGVERGPNGF